jgi:hypothetical protein
VTLEEVARVALLTTMLEPDAPPLREKHRFGRSTISASMDPVRTMVSRELRCSSWWRTETHRGGYNPITQPLYDMTTTVA